MSSSLGSQGSAGSEWRGTFGGAQLIQQVVLQLLHLPLVESHVLQELHPLRLQLLRSGHKQWKLGALVTGAYRKPDSLVFSQQHQRV